MITLPAPGPGASADLRHHLAQAYRVIQQGLNNSVQIGQDYEVGSAKIWVTAPDGTRHYVSVDNSGALSTDDNPIPGTSVTGAALTKIDDTNVTLTLGGTPATALLRATSLTLGWAGTLAAARGGTGISSYTAGNYINAASSSALQQRTPAQVRTDLGIDTCSSGTYSPTATGTVNVAAATAYTAKWMRIGNQVQVSGLIDIDPTSTGVTTLELSLPVASNFTSSIDAAGVTACAAEPSRAGHIQASAANDRATLSFVCSTNVVLTSAYTYTYEVK